MRRKDVSSLASAEPIALVTRDGRLTKEALLRVGLRRYKEHGYQATSLRKITEELGITVAATYYHFRSKDELLVAAFKHELEFFQTAHDNISTDFGASERLWTFVHLHTKLQRAEDATGPQPFGAALLISSIPSATAKPLIDIMRSIRNRLRDIIILGVQDKSFKKVHPTATTYAILGMSQHINYWFHQDGAVDINKLSGMYADFALRIVGAKPARNRRHLQSLTKSALREASAPQ